MKPLLQSVELEKEKELTLQKLAKLAQLLSIFFHFHSFILSSFFFELPRLLIVVTIKIIDICLGEIPNLAALPLYGQTSPFPDGIPDIVYEFLSLEEFVFTLQKMVLYFLI